MCDDLKEELDEGGKAALELCKHLERMGAASVEMPITVNDQKYIVSVKVVPEKIVPTRFPVGGR